jgi:hypothetical protein
MPARMEPKTEAILREIKELRPAKKRWEKKWRLAKWKWKPQ